MKKSPHLIRFSSFIVLSFLLQLSISGFGQLRLEFQNPYPQGNDLKRIRAINDDTLVAVGDLASVVWTFDSGLNWNSQILIPRRNLNDVFFINDTLGWAVGDSATIFKTIDAGATWTLTPAPTLLPGVHHLNSVFFTSHTHGYLGMHVGNLLSSGTGQIAVTNDGGQTWSSPISVSGENLQSVFFVDSLTGWAVGTVPTTPGSYGIYKTTDGAVTWQNQSISNGNTIMFTECYFWDSQRGVIVGTGGFSALTTDGGTTWIAQNAGTTAHLWGMAVSGDSLILGFGSSIQPAYAITRTVDTTHTWTVLSTSSIRNFNDGVFINDSVAWAVGQCGRISKTTDTGSTWVPVYTDVRLSLYDIYFCDSLYGWACGAAGRVFRTTDGGQNWVSYYCGQGTQLMHVSSFGRDTVVLFGGNKFYRSIDGGITWSFISNWTSVTDITPSSATTGILTTSSGSIYRTNDAGFTWTTVYSTTQYGFNDVYFSDSLNGWCVGTNGVPNSIILHTTDGGTTWTIQHYEANTRLDQIDFYDDYRGVAVGASGNASRVIRTSDSGNSWTLVYNYSVTAQDPVLINPFHFISIINDEGFSGNFFYPLSVAAHQHLQILSLNSADLYGLFKFNYYSGWTVGGNSDIVKYYYRCGNIRPVINVQGNTLSVSPSYDSYKWYINNSYIPNSNSQTITATQAGVYYVAGTDTNGCTSYSKGVYVPLVTGDHLISSDKSISVFPNPVETTATISVSSGITRGRLVVLNGLGQSVAEDEFTGNIATVNCESFPAGVYLVILSDNNQTIHTTRFIKP